MYIISMYFKLENLGGQSYFIDFWLDNGQLLIFTENLGKKTIVDAIFTLTEMENLKIRKKNKKDVN